ncbi:MAG: DUF924 family protein [Pseudomonadota bacterium]
MNPEITPDDVLNFWVEAGTEKWWTKDDAFDTAIRDAFAHTLRKAERGELDHWQETPNGTLALIILLDQFTRNLNRNSAKAFKNDPKALAVAEAALDRGDDKRMRNGIMMFAYMPLMHSENLADQRHCLALMEATGLEPNMEAAHEHLDIIERFGRFPHRNNVLGRETTAEEQAFLDAGGFSG